MNNLKLSDYCGVLFILVLMPMASFSTDFYTWDISTTSNIQTGNGTWGSDNYWTLWGSDGTVLSPWPGSTGWALFGGGDGDYTINVSGTQQLEGISFINGQYLLNGGTLSFGTGAGIVVAAGKTAVINTAITGTQGLILTGGDQIPSTINLHGLNSYTGVTTLTANIRCNLSTLSDGGTSCAIGSASNSAGNLVIDNSTLRYIGGSTSTDRLFTITATPAYLYSSGSGPISFTNSGAIGLSGSGARTIEIGGLLLDGDNIFNPIIADGDGGVTSISKTGFCKWILTGNNSYTGPTVISMGTLQIGSGGTTGSIADASAVTNNATLIFHRSNSYEYGGVISGNGTVTQAGTGTLILSGTNTFTGSLTVAAGTLLLDGSTDAGSPVDVASGATLGGKGTCGGPVTINGGTVTPGNAGAGKLTTGTLHLDAESVLSFDLGTQSDSVVINGDLILDGTINFTAAEGFTNGTYRLFNFTGTLTDNTLDIGSKPSGDSFILQNGSGYLSVVVSGIGAKLIQNEPEDAIVKTGGDASFTITATGEGTLSYSWLRYPGTVVGSAATLTIPSVTLSDNGARFRCVVSDNNGTDSSRWAVLTVYDTPRIIVQPHSETVTIGGEVTFSLTVQDTTQISYSWRKKGSASQLGTSKTFELASVTSSNSGEYYCVVTNPVGSVTSDTVQLTVVYPQPIALFSMSPTSGMAPLSVEFTDASIGEISSRLWDFGDGTTSSSTNVTHVYQNADLYSVKLVVSGPGGTDTLLQSDCIFAYSSGTNPVQITSRFLSGTDVEITLSNMNDIDVDPPAPECDSMGIWIKANALPKNRDDGTLYKMYKRSSFTGKTIIDTITLPTTDTLFGIISGLFWHDGTVSDFLSANGCTVLLRDSTTPSNPLTLTATATSDNSVRLIWNKISDNSISQVRIWYGTTEIDTGDFTPSSQLDAITMSTGDTAVVISGLAPETVYYFGIQVGLGTLWSGMTEHSRTSCKTLSGGAPLSPVVIDTLYFDSSTATIRISWCISERPGNEDVFVGITYSTSSFPVDTSGIVPIGMHTQCIETFVPLREPLQFNTVYYISLWYRTEGDVWRHPTDEARRSVTTGFPHRQVITIFDTSKTNDTVPVFNGVVLLWKDSTFTSKTIITDTIEIIFLDNIPEGMIPVCQPFKFRNAGPTLPFSVGIRVNNLLTGMTINDVRIYRVNAEGYMVDYGTVVDQVHHIVYTKTADLQDIFIAMIDLVPPTVTLLSDTAETILSTEVCIDSIRIKDNIDNVRWQYLFSSGDQLPQPRYHGELNSTDTAFSLVIPDSIQVISSETGIRVLLIIEDGAHTDTINISRSVIRYESDVQTINGKRWIPIYPTAQLKNNDIGSIIQQLTEYYKIPSYNKRFMRLFRWSNIDSIGQWIEYNPKRSEIRSLFSIEPGKLLWLKTLENIEIHFDTAYTLSLKDTFSVVFPPKLWTDFGMPFRFGVRMNEILSASGDDADSLFCFRWNYDSISGTQSLEQFFVPGMPDKVDRSNEIEYIPGEGYSFYNNSSKTVTLRIPPTLPSMGKKLEKKSAQTTQLWSSKFIAESDMGERFPAVYFGYAPGVKKNTYPVAPSFSALLLYVYDSSTSQRFGHYISEDAKNGIIQELQISNSSDVTQTIQYHFEKVGAFPENYTSYTFDASSKTIATDGAINIAPHSVASRWIVTGDESFRNDCIESMPSYHFSLHAPYPNPFRSSITISYTVPFNSNDRVEVAIYNILGKKIWKKRIHKPGAYGTRKIVWDARNSQSHPVGSGFYFVRLTVYDESGKTIKQFRRHVSLIR